MNPLSTVVHLLAEPSFRRDTAGGIPILSNILFHNQPSDFLLPIFNVLVSLFASICSTWK